MSKIIEAKAIISGEDRLSGVLDRVNAKLKQVGKGAKISADIDRLNKSLGNTKSQLAALDKINAAQAKLATARLGLSGAQASADRIAAQLAAARKVQDANAAADLAAQHKVAQRAVTQATGAVERQAGALAQARRAFGEFGVPVSNLVAHENALRASVERTTAAIERQGKVERERARTAEARALRRERRQEAIERAAVAASPARPAPPGRERPKGERTKVERNLGPLAGAFGAYEAASAYKQAAAFDRRLTMIGQTADAGREEIDKLGASIHDLAQQTATPVDKLAGGMEALVAQGRNLRESLEFIPSVAKTAAASGAEVEDIAKTADSVSTNFEISGRGMQKAFDIMAAGGKAGQFELKDMARYLPSLGPASSAIGFKGEKGLADLVAMLQIMRKGSGTSEEAVSSMNNILAKMESDKTKKGFKELGVDAEAAFKKARKEGKNLVEVFEELVDKALKGDRSRLGEIIDDMEFKRGVQALMAYRGEWQKLSRTLQDTSGGTVLRDLVQVTKDAQAGVDRLSNSWARFTQAAARAGDAGGVSAGLGDLGKELEEVAQALEQINRAYAEGGVSKLFGQAAEDVAKRFREKRGEWLDHYGGKEKGRVAELEADNKAFRDKLVKEGYSPESIEKTMRLRERDVERARRRAGAIEEAKGTVLPKTPLRMGVDPRAPIQGQPGAITPGIGSWQDAYPLDLSRSRPMSSAPLPPQRPVALPRTIDRIEDVLGPAGARNFDARVEATVKPDQITAKIDTLPPVTGEAKVDVESKVAVVLTLNEPMLQAKIESAAGKAVAKIPLSSSGSRPGAVSMPGASTTPGAGQ